jgi:hypothetical protein
MAAADDGTAFTEKFSTSKSRNEVTTSSRVEPVQMGRPVQTTITKRVTVGDLQEMPEGEDGDYQGMADEDEYEPPVVNTPRARAIWYCQWIIGLSVVCMALAAFIIIMVFQFDLSTSRWWTLGSCILAVGALIGIVVCVYKLANLRKLAGERVIVSAPDESDSVDRRALGEP